MRPYLRYSRDIALVSLIATVGLATFTDWGGPLLAIIAGLSAGARVREVWPAEAARRQALRHALLLGGLVGLAIACGQIVGTLFLTGLIQIDAPIASNYVLPTDPDLLSRHWRIVAAGTAALCLLDLGLSAGLAAAVATWRWQPPPTTENIWHKKPGRIARAAWGTGNIHPWEWYFEGDSAVKTANVEAIASWLRDCTYVRDKKLFMKNDFWQHPVTFEQIRKGDCEDHALWAWRKLTELGIPAEFVVGYWERDAATRHAWVVFENHGLNYLLEGTSKRRHPVQPLHQVWHEYRPQYGVDADFKTYRYYGASVAAPPAMGRSEPE